MAATVSNNNTRVTFTIDKSLKIKAEECAKKEKRSLSGLINIALEEYIIKHNYKQYNYYYSLICPIISLILFKSKLDKIGEIIFPINIENLST